MRPLLLLPLLLLLFTTTTVTTTHAAEVIIGADGNVNDNDNDDNDDTDCNDTDPKSCPYWAQIGECTSNPSYMHVQCKLSCGLCGCADLDKERCPHWAYRNSCVGEKEEFMYANCPKSCEACGYSGDELAALKRYRRRLAAVGGDARLLEAKHGYRQIVSPGFEREIEAILRETDDYMEQVVFNKDGNDSSLYKNVRNSCFLKSDSCAYWKTQGLCESNKAQMRQTCAPVCQICEELDFQFWCPIDADKPMAVPEPGDLNKLFERIVNDELFQQYQPNVISRPKEQQQQDDDTAASQQQDDAPWFLEFDSFLTIDECRHLIQLGAGIGYEQSVDTGVQRSDGSFDQVKSTWRTSATAWCSTPACLTDGTIRTIADRVALLTGIPQQNSEHLQLLKYETNEFYKYHHDCTPHHKDRQMGPRVLTLFLYLNTVEDGSGGTNFPDMNVTITPKIGKAVLWPNVLNDDPIAMDRRTAHQALPVTKGLKYGANLWIHQRDWREVAARGCI